MRPFCVLAILLMASFMAYAMSVQRTCAGSMAAQEQLRVSAELGGGFAPVQTCSVVTGISGIRAMFEHARMALDDHPEMILTSQGGCAALPFPALPELVDLSRPAPVWPTRPFKPPESAFA